MIAVEWYRDIGLTETIFVAVFILAYLIVMVRTIRVARGLKTPFHSVFIKFALRTVVFALLIVASLGPLFGSAKKEVKTVGKDIMICVDLSRSMDATDIAPTRVEKVKFELKRIVEAFNSDRTGIIIFSSEAFMQCPLTYDQNALNLFIETLSTSLVQSHGTDFAPPLRMALDKLGNNDSPVETKSKVIILISDGEDFGDETDQVADEIDNKGVKLFALGIGTESGGTIPTTSGAKTDKEGETVVTRLNPRSLKRLASRTGGEYFVINETRNDVTRLIHRIDAIEGELRDSRMVDVSANKYYYFLGLALILLMLDALVSIKTVRL